MPSEMMTEPNDSVATPATVEGPRLAKPPVALARYIVVLVLFLCTVPLMRMADGSTTLGQFPTDIGLKDLPRDVGLERNGADSDLDEISLSQLEPDEYLWRRYTKIYSYQGKSYDIPLDFMVVYGHKKSTFHSPGFCLPGGGWQIVAKSDIPLDSHGLPLPMNLFAIQRSVEGQQARQMVIYSFVQGDRATSNLIVHNINLLRARILHERPTGALVRVVVPVVTSEADAVQRATDFMTAIYPDLRKRIG